MGEFLCAQCDWELIFPCSAISVISFIELVRNTLTNTQHDAYSKVYLSVLLFSYLYVKSCGRKGKINLGPYGGKRFYFHSHLGGREDKFLNKTAET